MLTSPLAVPFESFLANGLKVVLVPAAAAPVVTVMVLYRVGARNEAVGYTGSSHLLEHMLFKGTPKNNRRNGRAFADIMNEIGASKNATTWIDRTNYFETVPLEFLPLAVELEADRMRGALISDVERRSEMTVVRNELERNDNSAARVLNSALVATAFREHPYHHPTIGWRTDVEGVSTDRLRELYDTYYRPGNAVAFVVGRVDPERTRDLIERHFATVPRSPVAVPDVHTSEPPQLGERLVRLKRPGDDAHLAYAFRAPAALGQTMTLSTPALRALADAPSERNDTYALEVLAYVLGRGRTSRLARALVDAGIALDATAWNWGSRDPGLFQIHITAVPGTSLDRVRRETDRVLETLLHEGPSAVEIERARAQIIAARAFSRDGTYALAGRLAELEAVGDWHLDDDYLERIAVVDAGAVHDAARSYLHEDDRTIGMLEPGMPRTIASVPELPVENRASFPGVPMAPLPLPQRLETERFAERIVRRTLANGLVVSYVAVPHAATVALRGLFEAGEAYVPGRPMLPSLVAEMLERGTTSAGRTAIEERLEGVGARRRYAVDDDRTQAYDARAFRLSAACTVAEVETLCATIAGELTSPAFAADELELARTDLTGSLRLLRTNTGWRAAHRFLQLAYEPGDPNAVEDLDGMLTGVEKTTLEDLRDHHARLLAGSRPALAAAGGLDEHAFFAIVERTLGAVPFRASVPLTTFVPHPRTALGERDTVELERKANVDIVIGRATSLARTSDDYLAATIANGILGQSTLSSRFGVRLRDREGLTYGVTSGFLGSTLLAGPWRVAASVNPANIERAIASVHDVLSDYATSGPTHRELVQQKNSLVGTHRVALATAPGLAAQLERIERYALGDDYVDTYRERIEAVDADAVRCSSIERYLQPAGLLVVTAGSHVMGV